MSETIKTLENGRALFAYEKVESSSKSSEYKAYIKKMPMMIKTNGLGHTLAFYSSKNETYNEIYKQIEEHLTKKYQLNNDLMKKSISQQSEIYRAMTTEVLALLNWMRRFVDTLIKD